MVGAFAGHDEIIVFKIAQFDGLLCAEGVIRRENCHKPVAHERDIFKRQRACDRSEAEIHPSSAEHFLKLLIVPVNADDMDRRILFVEAPEKLGEKMHRQAHDRRDAQRTGFNAAVRLKREVKLVLSACYIADMRQQVNAGSCKGYLVIFPVDQLKTELLLHHGNRMTDCRLRVAQLCCRL